uniref:B30.2/SPRY domain-containing protein n=1 Tax=Globodera rostochiensis TaxID=31243 RepID=A0A914HMR1_GLORO
MEPQATDTGRKLIALCKKTFSSAVGSLRAVTGQTISSASILRNARRLDSTPQLRVFRRSVTAFSALWTIVVEPTTGDIILIALFNLETAISFANMFTGIRNNSSCCFTCIIFCFKSCQKHRLRSRSISFSVCEEAKQVFEINVNRRTGSIFIGYAPKTMKFNCAVGRHNRSYSNESTGKIRGIAVPGCSYTVDGVPYIEGWPEFGRDNIISCGLSDTGRIVYTRHGQSLDTGDLFVHSEAELFPCISLLAPFDQIKANFGPNFAFMRR